MDLGSIKAERPTGSIPMRRLLLRCRLVREMIDGREMPAGVQSLRWDGRGSSGERLTSGVYLFEVRAGNEKSSSRLLLLGAGRKD